MKCCTIIASIVPASRIICLFFLCFMKSPNNIFLQYVFLCNDNIYITKWGSMSAIVSILIGISRLFTVSLSIHHVCYYVYGELNILSDPDPCLIIIIIIIIYTYMAPYPTSSCSLALQTKMSINMIILVH